MFSPVLESARLGMVNLGPEHIDFVFAHFGDARVHRYLVDTAPVRTKADAEEIIEFYRDPDKTLRNRWVLVLKSEDRPVGTLGFHAHDKANRAIEVGYDLSPPYWGKGLMSEALTAGLEHAFSSLDVYRVEAYVHVANDRSSALLARHGFTREGTIRAKYFFDGSWHDHHLYGLLEPDRRWKEVS